MLVGFILLFVGMCGGIVLAVVTPADPPWLLPVAIAGAALMAVAYVRADT